MDEQRIEKVLKLLGECIPRAPEKTVEKMVTTVNALEEKRKLESEQAKKEEEPTAEVHKEINNKGLGGPKL